MDRDARALRIAPPVEHERQQLAEHAELVVSRPDTFRPAARHERVRVWKAFDAHPKRITPGEMDGTDSCHDDRANALEAGLEGDPDGVVWVTSGRKRRDRVDLGMGERRVEQYTEGPAAFHRARAVGRNDRAVSARDYRSDRNRSVLRRAPCLIERGPPRELERS